MPKLTLKDVRKQIRATLDKPVGMSMVQPNLRQQINDIKKIKLPRI